ncbi:MAG: hypothetical protein A2157_13725 [Deltaproteobacteria bacterium RBG_16_47_11]|nr:MAG: hypothetical protein A2157_13725 [Deltaproteobacteria bacterium RBG_16_47_11]
MKKLEEKIDGFDEKALEEEVKSTRSLIQTFLQTVKGYRLYDTNHPILSKFLDRLKKDFDGYFDEFDSFSIQVKEHQLYCRGKVVYESQDVRESLAFVFYKDGVREIHFYRGLDQKEMTDFLNVVRKSDRVNRSEDDLVTLLWEKDFSHIDFTTVDEFLEGSGTSIPATEEDLAKKMEYRGGWEEGWTEKVDPTETESSSSVVVEGLNQAFSLSPGQSLVQACQLTPEESREINQVAQQEQQPEYLYVLIDNLIEILLHLGEDMDAYENMISFFQRAIELLLEQGEVKQALEILNHLNDALESIVLKDKQIFAIRQILEASSSPQAIECLGKIIRESGEVDSESTRQYLRLLTKQAIDPLCLLLGKVESGKWRRMICDRLAEFSQEEIQPLTKYLSDPDPFVVSHILYVLGKVGHPSTLKYLSPLVTHSDIKVREETLRLVARFEDKGKDHLQKFLKDTHPEIRGKASLALAKAAKGQAVKPLTEIILSEDFHKRAYEEKASFFKALGETRSKEAIPILQMIAKKRRWFGRAHWEEMRQCASMALKIMGVS